MKRALILSLLLLFSAVALADNNICVPVKGVEVISFSITGSKHVSFTLKNNNSKQVSVTVYVQYKGQAISNELDVTIDATSEKRNSLSYWRPEDFDADYMSIKIKEVTYCSF